MLYNFMFTHLHLFLKPLYFMYYNHYNGILLIAMLNVYINLLLYNTCCEFHLLYTIYMYNGYMPIA